MGLWECHLSFPLLEQPTLACGELERGEVGGWLVRSAFSVLKKY